MVASGSSAAGRPVALFCDRLRRLQKASGLTQKRLVEVSGRGRTQVSDILNGNIAEPPNWTVVEKIVAACLERAEQEGRFVPPDLRDREDWRRRYFDLEQDMDARVRLGRNAPSPELASAQFVYDRRPAEVIPAVQRLEPWVVHRPAEADQVVAALLRGGTVALTTALHGAGGFGKTTVAKMVRCDQRVLSEFGNRVYWVTVGRDTGAEALAGLVNGLIRWIQPGNAETFTDVRLAADYLAALLAEGPRRLLVVDDVWSETQLAAFPVVGPCARLVTTRLPLLVEGSETVQVRIDQMSAAQAHALLSAGLPPLPAAVADALLQETGRWPLLLRLANKILANAAVSGTDISTAGMLLVERLRVSGPVAVDDLLRPSGLDVDQPEKRAQAVRATIEASTSLLDRDDAERFAELCVFAEDEMVPFGLVARLWHATAGLDALEASQVCARLDGLALISVSRDAGGVMLHDVVRDFLRGELRPERLAGLHGKFLDGLAEVLPSASSLSPDDPGQARVAWWELEAGDLYLWEHLIEHLLGAGRVNDADAVAGDLRWVGARLQRFGPTGPTADLSLVGTSRSARLGAALHRAAHLLAPTEPTEAVVDVLHSRVADDPDWGAQVSALRNVSHLPRLVNRWPLPDLPDPATRRVLSGQAGYIKAVAIAPDGRWLAAGGGHGGGKVRVWNVLTGQTRLTLTGHTGYVNAVAVAPDGSWLATAGEDQTVRIWDAVSWQPRLTLAGHTDQVISVAVAPDCNWLATGSFDGTVRTWDAATGQARLTLTGDTGRGVAIAPDGSWLASGGTDGTVRTWDAASGQARFALVGHNGPVTAVAAAPDGSWLASGGYDGTVRTWDAASGQARLTLTGGSGTAMGVAVSPDGSWLATRSHTWGTVQICDAVTGQTRRTFAGHAGWPLGLAVAPDGSWLATGGGDGTVRIWDAVSGQTQPTLTSRSDPVNAMTATADGGWLATGSGDGTVRIWDAATGQVRLTFAGGHASRPSHRRFFSGRVSAITEMVAAPDGSWLATSGLKDGTVRISDAITGQVRLTLTGHTGDDVIALAVAPDGGWLATGEHARVRIWDAVSGQVRLALTGHTESVRSMAVAPDGSWLAIGDDDGRVRIWDAVTGQPRHTLTGHTGSVSVSAVAPDGSWLATGSTDRTVRIWDAVTGQPRHTLTAHAAWVRAIAASPDSNWLATGGDDQTVRIWDPFTGHPWALMRLENRISSCAWLGVRGFAAAGEGGIYVFDFLTEAASAAPEHIKT